MKFFFFLNMWSTVWHPCFYTALLRSRTFAHRWQMASNAVRFEHSLRFTHPDGPQSGKVSLAFYKLINKLYSPLSDHRIISNCNKSTHISLVPTPDGPGLGPYAIIMYHCPPLRPPNLTYYIVVIYHYLPLTASNLA